MSSTETGSLYLTRELAPGVNWRLTRFAEDVPLWSVCALCRVIAKRSVLLPCSHALCEPCRRGSIQDGEPVCPLDGEAFQEEECQHTILPARKADGMKAHCWNEALGCSFVGTLPAVLRHYEDKWSFHAVPCPLCGKQVLSTCLPTHCLGGCRDDPPPSSAAQENNAHEYGACGFSDELSEIKPTLRHHEQLPVLQTQLNDLTERTMGQELRLHEITAALSGNLEAVNARLTRILDKFYAALDKALQMEQEKRAFAVPQLSGAGERGLAGEAMESGTSTLAWRREKRHILRKLDLVLSGSLGCLEDIRRCAVVRMAHPTNSVRVASVRMERLAEFGTDSYPLDREESNGFHYLLTVANAEALAEYRAFKGNCTSPFTVVKTWHGRHIYFAVRVAVSRERGDRLELTCNWDRTCETHCSLPKVVRVKLMLSRSPTSDILKEDEAVLPPQQQVFYVDPKVDYLPLFLRDGNLLFGIEVDR